MLGFFLWVDYFIACLSGQGREISARGGFPHLTHAYGRNQSDGFTKFQNTRMFILATLSDKLGLSACTFSNS